MQQFFTTEISVNFNLRQTRKNKPTIVYCVLLIDSKRLKINTLVKVIPKQWNKKRQLAVVSPTLTPQDNRNNIVCNDRLCFLKKQIEQKLLSFTNYDTFVNEIINLVNPHQLISMAKKQPKSSVKVGTQQDIKTSTATDILREMLKNDPNVSFDSYKKTYSVYINTLETFFVNQKIKNEIKSLNAKVLTDYATHLSKKQTSSYAIRVFKLLRSWLKNDLPKFGVGYKYDEKIELISIKPTKITASEKGDEYIALNHEQIYKIYNLSDDELQDSTLKLDKLRFYRDMFCMQCFCGCRASDIVKLFDKNNLREDKNGNPFIEFWAKKTEGKEKVEKCVVPFILYPEQLILLNKYKDVKLHETQFTGGSDNSYNKHIKELCRIAKFDNIMTRTVEAKGGKKKTENKPLYECMTSHVARHSFITNCVRELNLPPNDIKDMVGHGDTQYIEKVYLNLTTTDKANKITTKLNKNKQPQQKESIVAQPSTPTSTKKLPKLMTTASIDEFRIKRLQDNHHDTYNNLINALDAKISSNDYYEIINEVDEVHKLADDNTEEL